MLFPVFEVCFFFFPFFFFFDAALFLLPIDEAHPLPSALAGAITAALRRVAFVGAEVFVLVVFIFEEAPRVGWEPLWPFKDLIICFKDSISEDNLVVFFLVSFWTNSLRRTRLAESSSSTSICTSTVEDTVKYSSTSFFSANSTALARCCVRYWSNGVMKMQHIVREIKSS